VAKCSSALLVTALAAYMEEIWFQQHLCDHVAASMKIAWRLPFLPTHLISDHFLIGVHGVCPE